MLLVIAHLSPSSSTKAAVATGSAGGVVLTPSATQASEEQSNALKEYLNSQDQAAKVDDSKPLVHLTKNRVASAPSRRPPTRKKSEGTDSEQVETPVTPAVNLLLLLRHYEKSQLTLL